LKPNLISFINPASTLFYPFFIARSPIWRVRFFAVISKDKSPISKQKPGGFLRVAAGLFLATFFLAGTQLAVAGFLARINIFRAYRLLNTSAFLQAEIPTSRAVRCNPQSGYTHYYKGVFLKKAGKKQESLREFDRALRTTAHPASVHRVMGEVALEKRDFTRAAGHYRASLFYDPSPRMAAASSWYKYGRAAQAAAKGGEALFAFRKAENLTDPPAMIGPSIGFLLASMNLPDAGIQAYLYGLEKNPGLLSFLPRWSLTMTKSGMTDFGKELFTSLDSRGKLDAGGLCLLASFHFHQEDHQVALKVLERAEMMNPEEPNIYLLKGEIYSKTGRDEEMNRMFRRFLEMYPNAPQKEALQKRMRK